MLGLRPINGMLQLLDLIRAQALALTCDLNLQFCPFHVVWIFPQWRYARACHLRLGSDLSEVSSQILYITGCFHVSLLVVCLNNDSFFQLGPWPSQAYFLLFSSLKCLWSPPFWTAVQRKLGSCENLPGPALLTEPLSPFMPFTRCVEYVSFDLQNKVILCHWNVGQLLYNILRSRTFWFEVSIFYR